MNESTAVARAVVAALRRVGVTDVVLAPGSRSAPLALALASADAEESWLTLHVRIDERTAGFLALGLAKGSHRMVPVVTTSGTAVANLHPAVLEACHAGERLLVLSADRPAEMRGTGANQTTLQHALFGPRVAAVDVAPGDVRAAVDGIADAVRRRGPTQLNLQLREPLLPDEPSQAEESADRSSAGTAEPNEPATKPSPERSQLVEPDASRRLATGPRTVVVAGDDAGPRARLLAEQANWPLLAEPTSGARTGSHALRSYRLVLQTALAQQVERVVVTGHPSLSRPVTRLISRNDVEVISVRGPGGVATDPGRVAEHLDAVPVVDGTDSSGWMEQWRAADRALGAAVDSLAAGPDGLPLRVASEVAAAVPAEGLLFVGSSQPIRDLDVMAAPFPPGQRRLVIGNRGLAGIDGTVSSALGAALGRRSSRALAYMGDLTFLHDATGLIVPRGEPLPALTVVVVNDDGGAIFSTLEQGAPEHSRWFERVFGTPHGVSIAAWCEATRTSYARADDADRLRGLLAMKTTGVRVVEVTVDRRRRRTLNGDLLALSKAL